MSKKLVQSQISPVLRSDEIILESFARLDRTAFAVAVGALFGLLVLAATIVVSSRGDPQVLPLVLLAQFFPGYTVTFRGALLGLVYGFISGYVLGWLIALIRNASLGVYLRFVKKKAELSRLGEFLERG